MGSLNHRQILLIRFAKMRRKKAALELWLEIFEICTEKTDSELLNQKFEACV